MKLIIFTPVIKKSAIGKHCKLITRELLSQGHDVVIVRTEYHELLECKIHAFGTLILHWTQTEEVKKAIQTADSVIYQVGNNYYFHAGVLNWLPKHPGVVILHDYFLGNLFAHLAQRQKSQLFGYLKVWYGEKVANNYLKYLSQKNFINQTHTTAPMTELVCSMATAVITHSSWGCGRVLNSCPGPVHTLPLAYNSHEPIIESTNNRARISDKFIILTFGQINPNKRIESVIQAISKSHILKDKVTYHLIGTILPEVALEYSKLAKINNVELIISGEVDDQELQSAINKSTIVSCLRWPCLEAASASLIEALLNGKPVIVTNSGFYKEIPDSCVLKVNPQNEISELQIAFEFLINNQEQRKAMSKTAQQWAANIFCNKNYVNRLIEIIEDVALTNPVLEAINFFCETMNGWDANIELFAKKETIEPLLIFNQLNRS